MTNKAGKVGHTEGRCKGCKWVDESDGVNSFKGVELCKVHASVDSLKSLNGELVEAIEQAVSNYKALHFTIDTAEKLIAVLAKAKAIEGGGS